MNDTPEFRSGDDVVGWNELGAAVLLLAVLAVPITKGSPEFRTGDDVSGWQNLLPPLAAVFPAGDDVDEEGPDPLYVRLILDDRKGPAYWKVTHSVLPHACSSRRPYAIQPFWFLCVWMSGKSEVRSDYVLELE